MTSLWHQADYIFCINTPTTTPYVARVNGERVGWGQKSEENRKETTTYSEKDTVSNKQFEEDRPRSDVRLL